MNQVRYDGRDVIWFSAFLLLGSVSYLLRAVDFFAAAPGDLGDARFNSVILEHVFQWVTGKVESLWSPPFFYPFENVLAFSDNHFGSSPVYIVFRQLGLSREIAFDAWFITGFVLNYAAAYVAARRLMLSHFAAGVCAFAFTFALPALHQEGHAQLTYRFAIPLAFAAFLQMVTEKRLVIGQRVAFWIAVQFYCSIYLGVFLVYLLTATAVVTIPLVNGRRLIRSLVQSLAAESGGIVLRALVILAASLVAIAALIYKYKTVAGDYGFTESTDYIAAMLPRLSSYLLADRAALSSWLGGHVEGLPMRHEHQMFAGIGIVLLAVYGATGKWVGSAHILGRRAAVGAFGILFLLTLSVAGHSLYFGLLKLPGLEAIRAVSRIVLVMLWPIAFLAGIGVQRLQTWLGGRGGGTKAFTLAIVLALLGVEVAAYSPAKVSIGDWRVRQSSLQDRLPQEMAPSAVLFLTVKETEHWSLIELDSMMLAQDTGLPTFNGYSGRGPPGNTLAAACLALNDRIRAYKRFRGETDHEMLELASRAVCIDRSPGVDGVVLPFRGSVTPDQARGIDVGVTSLTVSTRAFDVTIRVTNNGPMSISTWNIMNPVRLSWRFVPIAHDGSRLSEPGWDARHDVSWTVRPGEFRSARISGPLQLVPGRYLFEVSLVQENVAFLHDLGMSVASEEVDIGPAD